MTGWKCDARSGSDGVLTFIAALPACSSPGSPWRHADRRGGIAVAAGWLGEGSYAFYLGRFPIVDYAGTTATFTRPHSTETAGRRPGADAPWPESATADLSAPMLSARCGDYTRRGRGEVSMQLRWGSASDVGRVRELNEDSVVAGPEVFAVADGMGGHASGEVASALLIQRLTDLAEAADLRDVDVEAAIAAAHDDMIAAASSGESSAAMGTTVSGVAVVQAAGRPHWLVFNVGDSRTYRWRDGGLEQVTVDHSEVQEMLLAGSLTKEEARTYSRRNVVTRAVGPLELPAVDRWLLPMAAGERFLVCSDGLVNELSEHEIAHVLANITEPEEAARQLVADAVAAGGRDNVSVVIVQTNADVDAADAMDEDTAPRAGAGSPS